MNTAEDSEGAEEPKPEEPEPEETEDDALETFENPVSGDDVDETNLATMDVEQLSAEVKRLRTVADKLQLEANQKILDSSEKDEQILALVGQIRDKSIKQTEKSKAYKNRFSQSASNGSEAFIHRSTNTIGELDVGIEAQSKGIPSEQLAEIDFVWGLVFTLPKQEYDVTGNTDPSSREVSHEVWVLVNRLWACDLHVRYTISNDDRTIIIQIGATFATLIQTATDSKMGMRLQYTRGSAPFHPDLTKYYARNHAGLNEWDYEKHKWNLRAGGGGHDFQSIPVNKDDAPTTPGGTDREPVEGMAEADLMSELEELGVSMGELTNKSDAELRQELVDQRAIFDHENDSAQADRMWTTAMKQRLVKFRVGAMGGINFEMRLHAPLPEETMKWMFDHAVKARRTVRSMRVSELLTSVGGFRPHADEVFPKNNDGECIVDKLAKQCMADPQFVLKPGLGDNQRTSEKLIKANVKPVSYSELVDVLEVLKVWRDPIVGPGRLETFVGTFLEYFPIHDHDELMYLKHQWGNFGMLTSASVLGYFEGGDKAQALGHPKNPGQKIRFPFVWSWQPIHEVRDYFGEDTALYYAWLGHYTGALLVCMLIGCVTMALQPVYGGVQKNPATLAYSVYVGLWSVTFLEAWKRKEVEFRFLWGSEVLNQSEDIRPQFEGKLIVTETGRERVVYKSSFDRYRKVFSSYLVVFAMIAATVFSALAASLVRTIPSAGQSGYSGEYEATFAEGGELEDGCLDTEKYASDHPCGFVEQQKWGILSSVLNLLIIQSMGQIYERMALFLNNWENHRTASEWDNALVVKNFLFQFANNYFLLFYIAFFREGVNTALGMDSAGTQRCAGSSCLPELQSQLMVVFTGKTVAKQLGHTIKPFITKWRNKMKVVANQKKFEQEMAERMRDGNYKLRADQKAQVEFDGLVAMSDAESQANLMP
jgi:hypothetical protein